MTKKCPKCLSLLSLFFTVFVAVASVGGVQRDSNFGRVADYSHEQENGTLRRTISSGVDIRQQKRWDLSRVKADQSWQITAGKPEVLVAVLDTGIDESHEALAGKVVGRVNFSNNQGSEDRHGHGTHIAGIIAASPALFDGIAGLAYDITLLNVKVANDDGTCDAAAIANGIVWAVDHGANVINVSLTIDRASLMLEEAVNYAWERGSIVVAAAGNDYGTKPTYPAAYANTIAVTATGADDLLPRWANHGDWVDVGAPGVDIYSSLPGDQYERRSGTSMAAALVSAEAGLLFAMAADANGNGRINDEVRTAIESGTEPLRAPTFTTRRINVFKALDSILTNTESTF